jgi:hypothetical protein
VKLWRKTRSPELWAHDPWRIWAIQDYLGNRKFEIHCWVLYDGMQVIACKPSRKAIFRVANRLMRREKS